MTLRRSQSSLKVPGWFATMACVAIMVFLTGCDSKPPSEPKPVAVSSGSVTVVVNYTNAPSETVHLPNVASGSTVLEVMQMIESPAVVIEGAGSNALVTQIGDLKESSSEGWTYYINGKWADQGIGTATVAPDDEIQWRYGDWSSSQE